MLTIIGMIKAIGRIPMMKMAAIPFGLCALLIFCVPLNYVSGWNAVWIAAFLWGYYFFCTLYMIPHNALLPELIQDGPLRVNAYTISSFFFVTGSALGYATPLIVNLFRGGGMVTLSAWRTAFVIYTVIGVTLLLIPAFTIQEKDYVHSIRPSITLSESLKHAFSNKHFRVVTLGQLLEGTGMAFFQACIMYYVTSLMGLPETYSVVTGAAAEENVGVPGLKLTAVAGSLFCILAIFVLLRYNEREVLDTIAAADKKGERP